MSERAGLFVFDLIWVILMATALLTKVISYDTKVRRRAGTITNLLIVIPFLLVFGLFYLGYYVGTYHGNALSRTIGALVGVIGLLINLMSHVYLRSNWSLSLSIKEGHELVITGLYHYVRHPIYSSMIIIVLGSGLLVDNYFILISTILVSIVYLIRARKEETILAEEFPEYREYASKTKMFIPGVF